jgi:predicted HAD superfamily phosphohydrolase
VRLKAAIPNLVSFLENGLEGCRFSFHVISAAPREIVLAALDGILAPENIHGTELEYDAASGEVTAIKHVPAGYGKVAVIEELQRRLGVAPDRVIYVGDGSSDVHVMLHVNSHDGFTIAVSDNRQLARIARSVVVSDNVFAVMVPVLDQVFGWRTGEIRELLELNGLTLEAWRKARTDHVEIAAADSVIPAPARATAT